jgi:3-isopropylmalate dehydrogenase
MKLKILVVAGDGIGPEVTREAVKVLRSVAEVGGREFQFAEALIGGAAIRAEGSPLPQKTLDAALASDAVLLGAVGGNEFNALPPDRRPEAGLLQLRQALGGFANLRPAFAYPALAANSPLRPEVIEGADILFVRELLGGLYFGQPRAWQRESNSAWNTMRYTRDEVVRVARVAFELASHRRKKVTSVDKANVLEVSQLWRATVTEIATQYPEVTLEHQYVDACAMHLMKRRATSTSCSRRIFSATSSPTNRESSPARSACCLRRRWVAPSIYMSRYTAPRRTSPAKALPIRSAPS